MKVNVSGTGNIGHRDTGSFVSQSVCVQPSENQALPMGSGSDRVSPRDQQSPVVSSMSCGDAVVYPLHTNSGVRNPCVILNVRNYSLYSSVNLQKTQINRNTFKPE